MGRNAIRENPETCLPPGRRTGTVPAVSDDPARRRWWKRLWDTRLDLSPLRTRDFRLLFIAATAGYLGAMVGYVSIPFQIFRLTGSNLAVGIVGGIELIPLIVFGLWGGALADRFDRRTIMVLTGVITAVLAAALLANSLLAHPRVWVMYVIAGLLSMSSSLQRPSQDALVPRTVGHDQLTAAVAAWSLAWQLASLIGPSIGGVLIARYGVAVGYALWVAGALVSVVLLARLGPYPPAERSTGSAFRSIGVGLRYAIGRRDLLGTYVVDLVGMFMAMPTVLFPAFGIHVFGRPELVGLLYASEGLGSALATVTSGWMSAIHRHGRAITLAAICWGAAIGLAGLAPWFWLAFGLLILAGAFDQISGTFRTVLWNQTIPDELRGRLAGIEMLSYSIGPLGGQLRAGTVADLTGVRAAIASGGALCVLGVAATTAALRGFWSYDNRTDPHSVRERERRAAAGST
ncbi:MAG: MFS transporter [Microlunatus sp.]|nr:MFS transporter [Microlunatus sp.]